jgi:hypothetical protein
MGVRNAVSLQAVTVLRDGQELILAPDDGIRPLESFALSISAPKTSFCAVIRFAVDLGPVEVLYAREMQPAAAPSGWLCRVPAEPQWLHYRELASGQILLLVIFDQAPTFDILSPSALRAIDALDDVDADADEISSELQEDSADSRGDSKQPKDEEPRRRESRPEGRDPKLLAQLALPIAKPSANPPANPTGGSVDR